MRQSKTSITGVGSSPWLPFDLSGSQFQVGYGCVVSGTTSYTVEYTYDDVLNKAITPIAWSTTISAQTANKDGSFIFPVAAVRVTTASGSGSVVLTAIQEG